MVILRFSFLLIAGKLLKRFSPTWVRVKRETEDQRRFYGGSIGSIPKFRK